MAVEPIAKPPNARLTRVLSANNWFNGELGCSSSTPKTHAEIMKAPSAAASIKYSGQCLVITDHAVDSSDVRVSEVIVCIESRLRNDWDVHAYSH